MARFAGKSVIITGGSSGIGLALARQLAGEGAQVCIAARREAELATALRTLPGTGHMALQCDVAKPAECEVMVQKAIVHFGKLDVLVNNAGISMRAPFVEAEVSVLERLMQVNFWGSVYCTKAALPALLRTKGSIVGVSSIAGYVGLPGRTGYSASKFAMHGFLQALRTENLHTGLHVLLACPGFTASNIRQNALLANGTTQFDSPRDEADMMPAEEVAKHICDALYARKAELVLTSQGKLSVFLSKFVPRFVEQQVLKHFMKEEKTLNPQLNG